MSFSLYGERSGFLRNPVAVMCSLVVWLSLVCVGLPSSAQLKVGQPLDFGSATVGNPVTLDVVFSAVGTTSIASASVLTDGATGQDFTLNQNSCLGTIQQNANCAVKVTFTARQVGARHGALLLYDGSGQIASEVFLHGIGLGGAFAFAPAHVTSNTTAPGLSPATFSPGASVLDGYGNIYFTDVQNHRILKQTPAGAISLVASLPVTTTSSIAISPVGTLFVSALNAVYAFLPGATPLPLLTGTTVLVSPSGLAVDSLGGLYIADAATGQIARYDLQNGTTTAVSLAGLTPGLSSPRGLALDESDNLYVADSGNDRIVEISASSGSSTLPVFTGLTLNNPTGLTVDPAGTIYVADTGNGRLVELTVNGVAFALTEPNFVFNTPIGVLMKPNADLVVSDTTLGQVLLPRSMPSLTFPTATVIHTQDTQDGALPLMLQATGNSVAQLVFPTSGTEPTIDNSAFGVTTAGSCPTINLGSTYTPLQFTIGDVCTYTVQFTPTVVGPNTGNFEVDINLPGGSAVYTTIVPLAGTGLTSTVAFSLVATPSRTTVGNPVALTLTALNAANGVAVDYTGTVHFTTTDTTDVFLGGTSYTLTAANQGVLTIPANTGLQFNQHGTFTAFATDGVYQATSNPVQVLNITTVASFTSSINPSLPNQTTSLSITLSSAGPTPTGTVTFYSGTTALGTADIVNGVATLPASFATPGTYALTAVYSGDNSNAPVTSSVLNQRVLNLTTVSSFTSSINPSIPNQTTDFILTLASTGPTPSGTVRFLAGTTLLGTATVANGVATLPASFPAVGPYAITAVYSGDQNDATVTANLNQLVVNPVSIAITSSINPSLLGQAVTLSTTVSSISGTPTGTVQFYDGATLLGSATLSGGNASLLTTFTSIGIHTLTVVYAGDPADVGATSAGYAQDVVTPTISGNLTSSINPSLAGQTTVLTETVSSTLASPTPTGTVSFYSGTTLLGTSTLSNGAATLPVSFAAVGAYALTAVYSGDTDNATVTSGPLTQVVLGPGTVVLTSSVNPSVVQLSTTLTAFLGATTGTGTVSFYDGATLLGTSTVSSGTATLPASFSTVGLHSLTAVYSGDANNGGATSAPLAQDVVSPTLTSLTSSVNPSLVNQATTLQVVLTSQNGAPAPTGSATFYSNGVPIGTATIVNGVATLSVSFPAIGAYTIKAVYLGDVNNAAAIGGPLTQVVVAPGAVVLTSSINPTVVQQSTTLTAFLGTTTATGTVNFLDGSTTLGTATVVNGVATLPASFTIAGIHTLTAVYAGDSANATATSAPVAQDVVTPTVVTLASSVNPSLVNQLTTLQATLASEGGSPTPAGSVTFYSNGVPLGAAAIVNGVATLPVSFAAVGAYALKVVFPGDTYNAAALGGPLTQLVLAPGSVVLTSSVNPSQVGQSTTLSAFLGSTTATGSVSFYDGSTLLGTGTVANGAATLLAGFNTAGTHTLTAVYSGDSSNAKATSSPLLQDVQSPTIAGNLTSSVNPSQTGQSTTLSVTLGGSSTTPTGTVQFLSGTTLLGTAPVLGGIASLPASFAVAGTFTLTAVYSGDNNNASTTAGPLTQIVFASGGGSGGGGSGNSVTVVLTSSVNPSLIGQSTTLSAFLSATNATGAVSFYDGATLLGGGTVANGLATLSASFNTTGAHSLTAVYSGDSTFAQATSPALTQNVQTTTIAGGLTSSVNPSQTGQSTTLSVTLTNNGTAPAPTGTVTFSAGGVTLGSATISNGVASLSTSFATVGSYTLTAVYSGDTSNATVTAGPLTQVVITAGGGGTGGGSTGGGASSIVLTSSINPSLVAQTTLLTAFVGPVTATGTVSFYDGATLLGTATLVSGTARLPAAFTTVGLHSLTAVYAGDANNATSTSTVLAQDVVTPTTATTFSSSVNPSQTGQSTTLTLNLTGSHGTATGTVTFYSGATALGTVAVVNGTATLPVSFSAQGSYPLTAVYSGDTTNATVTAGPLTQVVVGNGGTSGGGGGSPTATSAVLTSSINPTLVGQPTLLSAFLSAPTATGTVSFYDGTALLGTGTLSSGLATLAVSFSTSGLHSLTAVYSGDTHFTGSTSAAYTQDVLTPTTLAASLTSSINPSQPAQTTTLAVTLAGASSTPTGSVAFYNGTILLGTAVLSNGTASLPASFAAVGSYPLTAVYSGDTHNATVTTGPLTQVVVASNAGGGGSGGSGTTTTSIVLTSSVNPSLQGQATALQAFVGPTTATGTVSFYDGTTLLGTGTLSGGFASFTASFGTTGVHALTAVYSGDVNDTASTSSVLAQDVVTITIAGSLTSSVNPSQVNQTTTLAVQLHGASTTPTGTVQFLSGTTVLGTALVANGTASLSISFAASGSYTLTAVYSGDTQNAPVTTAPLTQVVVNTNGGGGGNSGFVVLTSSVNPSLVGQSTTLSAFLGSTTATGSIIFLDGTTTLGTAFISNGLATLPASFTVVGLHSLTAVYSGDGTYAQAISAAYAQQVDNPTIAASFTSSVNPSLVGQTTSLTVVLTSSSPSLTGSVKFYDAGTILLGTGAVANGLATLSTSFATSGTHTLTAVYSGDATHATVTTGPLAQLVINISGVTLSSSVNPVLLGANTTLSATLGSSSATGTVTFLDGTTTIGSAPVSSGLATLVTSFTTGGARNLTAVYSGDTNDAKATSPIYVQNVQVPDTAVLTASAPTATAGQPITLTATIASTYPGTPTGTVSFYNGATLLGTVTLSNAAASLPVTFNTIGPLSLTCTYSGDTNFAPSPCAALALTVADASTVTLASSANPSFPGQSVTFTAKVASTGPTPTGSISFYNGTTLLATVALPLGSNVATYATSTLPIGPSTIKATYSGDTNTLAGSATLTQIVLNPATIVFACPAGPVLLNTATTLTATVSSTGGSPTGTVKFLDGTTLLGTGTLVNGVATISASFTTLGSHSLTAVYSGDASNGTVTSIACATQAVEPATIALTSSVNPAVVKQTITFTATVASPGPAPTGSVQFFSGTTLLGKSTITNGIATLPASFATAGTYPITAVYSGDGNTATVSSTALQQVVLNIATVLLTSQISPILLDNQDLLTATLTSTGPTPTGLVTFYAGTAPLGNATLINGKATLSTSFPVTGNLNLTAVYYGDPITAPATSPGVGEVVGDIAVAIATGLPSTQSVLAGGTAQYSLVLTPLIVDPLPSTVVFSITGLPKGATASFSPATVAAGQSTTPFVLTVITPAITGQLRGQPPLPGGLIPLRTAPIVAAFVLLPLAFIRRRKLVGKFGSLLLLVLLAAGATGLTGCLSASNSGYYGQTPQTYTLTVTATSGQLSRSTPVTLVVQ
jgi:hypothetical protein